MLVVSLVQMTVGGFCGSWDSLLAVSVALCWSCALSKYDGICKIAFSESIFFFLNFLFIFVFCFSNTAHVGSLAGAHIERMYKCGQLLKAGSWDHSSSC